MTTRTWPSTIAEIRASGETSVAGARWAMDQVLGAAATPAQYAAVMIALEARGISASELVGFRAACKADRSTGAEPGSVVVSLGDPSVTLAIALVCAAVGTPAAAIADRGPELRASPAPNPAAYGWRRTPQAESLDDQVSSEIGVPGLFDRLEPLIGPSGAETAMIVGIADRREARIAAVAFGRAQDTAIVVRGDDGTPLLAPAGHSHLWETVRGSTRDHDVDPRELGLQPRPSAEAQSIESLLSGDHGRLRDLVVLNAAAALTAGFLALDPASIRRPLVERLRSAQDGAAAAIDSGRAAELFTTWTATNGSVRPRIITTTIRHNDLVTDGTRSQYGGAASATRRLA